MTRFYLNKGKKYTLKVLVLLFFTTFSNISPASYSSDTKNYNQGIAMYRELQGGGLVDNDLLVLEYMSALSSSLNYSPVGTINNLNLFVVKDLQLNAFAFFGNNIGLHQGLILDLDNENELAAVVSHEMAHIHLKHLDRFAQKQQQMLPASILAIIGAIAIGSPDLATAAMANHYQQVLGFSREHEKEADRVGMQILSSNKFNPNGMPQAFAKLEEKNSLNAKAQEFLSTHPIFSTRISDTASRASQYGYIQHADSFLYKIAKSRIELQTRSDLKKYIQDLEHKYRNSNYVDRNIFEYKLALSYSKDNQFSKAYALINALNKRVKSNWVYALAAAEIYINNGKYEQAYRLLKKINKEYPDHAPVLYYYGVSLAKTKRLSESQKVFTELSRTMPDKGFIYEAIAKNFNDMSNKLEMHQSLSKAYVMYQQLDLAVEQLDIAIKYAKNSEQKKIITKEKESIIAQKKYLS